MIHAEKPRWGRQRPSSRAAETLIIFMMMSGCANVVTEGDPDLELMEAPEATGTHRDQSLGHGDHDAPLPEQAQTDVSYPEGNLEDEDRTLLRVSLAERMAGEPTDGEEVAEDGEHVSLGDEEASDGAEGPAVAPEALIDDDLVADAELLDEDVATQFDAFLDDVVGHEGGGFSIQDIYFPSEESLQDYFFATHTDGLQDKGLYGSNFTWENGLGARKYAFTACFTPDSNSSEAQRRRVAELVGMTWQGAAGVYVTWFDSNGITRVCDPNDPNTADFKIYHHSEINRGCAALGDANAGTNGVNCGTVCCPSAVPGGCFPNDQCDAHPIATIALPATASTLTWREATALHEMGHAFGLEHEARRSDATVSCGTGDFQQENSTAVVDVRVGAYDIESVMQYQCAASGMIDEPLISVGDIATIQAALPRGVAESGATWPIIAAERRDWASFGNFSVDLTIVHDSEVSTESFQTASYIKTIIGSSTNWGYPEAGEVYTVSATTNTPGIKCTAAPSLSKVVRGAPSVIPPEGMEDDPIRVGCYDPAQLMLAL